MGLKPSSLDLPPPGSSFHSVQSCENKSWHSDPYSLSTAPERVLLHKGQGDSSEAPQDLLGLTPKLSGGPGWKGTPLAGSMLELEAEERGERGVTWREPGEAASLS